MQLPPSLAFEPQVVRRFFQLVRSRYSGLIVCEPRHETWFSPQADAVLVRHEVARVAADPVPAAGADRPAGWTGVVYYRLHGSPRKYWSKYEVGFIEKLAAEIAAVPASIDVWCVFDNTASGAALENALELQALLR